MINSEFFAASLRGHFPALSFKVAGQKFYPDLGGDFFADRIDDRGWFKTADGQGGGEKIKAKFLGFLGRATKAELKA
jgi:hypothetical protein